MGAGCGRETSPLVLDIAAAESEPSRYKAPLGSIPEDSGSDSLELEYVHGYNVSQIEKAKERRETRKKKQHTKREKKRVAEWQKRDHGIKEIAEMPEGPEKEAAEEELLKTLVMMEAQIDNHEHRTMMSTCTATSIITDVTDLWSYPKGSILMEGYLKKKENAESLVLRRHSEAQALPVVPQRRVGHLYTHREEGAQCNLSY